MVGEDFDGEEAFGFGEKEGGELSDEPEVVVRRRVAVEGWVFDWVFGTTDFE